jgi:N-acetylglutamate synthase-like GNAT family acetyltransferase
MPRRLLAIPLAPWEREGLKSALLKAALAVDDIGEPGVLFWRFETFEDIPVGFGGIEVHGRDALLRSLVVLPPLRQLGMGAAIVGLLEIEARALKCETMYVVTGSLRELFVRLGYAGCAVGNVPEQIRESREFVRGGARSVTMKKRFM